MNATLPVAQRRVFWVVLLAIPLAFFALLEGGLRLGGYGTDTALFAEVEHEGVAYYVINPRVVRRYFGDPDFGTYVSRDRFRVQKEEGTYRIFALGASTTVGFPYLFHGSFTSLLRDRLVTRFPDRRVEVVNVGITAVNSYAVADLAREVMRYEPDLVLVYAGHNEFYGTLGAGSSASVGGRRWMVRTYLFLQRFKTVQLVRDGVAALGSRLARPAEDGAQLMERMVANPSIPLDSPLYRRVQAAFEANYRETIRTVRRGGADLLVATVASNLRDQPPFVPVHGAGVSSEDQRRWREAFDAGREAAASGACDAAVAHFREAIARDAMRADGHFELGRCLERLGAGEEAAAAYRRARDLDGLRFRASSGLNAAVRALAAEAGVPVVDVEAAFAEASPHGLVGAALMTEHVHPTFEGYFLMAQAFEAAMASHGLFAAPEAWQAAEPLGEDDLRRFAGLTAFDHTVADLRVRQLTSRWPFRAEPEPFHFAPQTPAERMAWDYLQGRVAWAAGRDALARQYAQSGDEERAADELWALAKVVTYDPHFALQAADLHARGGRFGRAAPMYGYAASIDPQPFTVLRQGVAELEAGDAERAVVRIREALALSAGRPLTLEQRVQAHLLLARAHARLGDSEAAANEVSRARALAPRPPQAPAAP